jgi:hypothetical protein
MERAACDSFVSITQGFLSLSAALGKGLRHFTTVVTEAWPPIQLNSPVWKSSPSFTSALLQFIHTLCVQNGTPKLANQFISFSTDCYQHKPTYSLKGANDP